jgi:glycosyltransferase involved in cell wall biosynthesis
MEHLLVDFARFSDLAAVEPSFLALQDVGEPARQLRELGVPVREGVAGRRSGLPRLLRVAQAVREMRPDVIHTHNPAPQVWGVLAGPLAGGPAVIHTRHGHALGTLPAPFVGGLFRGADRVVCVSEDLRRDLLGRYRLAEDRVIRIWNGIDTARFAWAGPRREPTAVTVSRLALAKDVPTLLRATAIVARELPAFRLRVAGDGPERAALEALARGLGIAGHVEFLGERHDVPALLAGAGLFVSSSLTEGLSLTLAEAMAVGLPVLATATGGNPEIVLDGVTGRLVPPGEPRALAEGLLALWAARERWTEMGRAGRDRVRAHFDARRMVRDYEHLYALVLEERARRRSVPDARLNSG